MVNDYYMNLYDGYDYTTERKSASGQTQGSNHSNCTRLDSQQSHNMSKMRTAHVTQNWGLSSKAERTMGCPWNDRVCPPNVQTGSNSSNCVRSIDYRRTENCPRQQRYKRTVETRLSHQKKIQAIFIRLAIYRKKLSPVLKVIVL